jgi:hypothetical protein
MSLSAARLPSRFPVGTRFVIEGRGGRISMRYLEFPDGRQIQLPNQASSRRNRTRHRPGSRK